MVRHTHERQRLERVLEIARLAGREILDVYEHGMHVDYKADGSPVTNADRRAHAVIERSLQDMTPEIPILSEESERAVFDRRFRWSRFWLVDPLDGTREFVSRNGEFTINIALVEPSGPVLGVVHSPVHNTSYCGLEGHGAFMSTDGGSLRSIRVRSRPARNVTMVCSRSHAGANVEQFRKNMARAFGTVEMVGMGSSLKICLVAEGVADVYPRLGPTSEWDTAAAQCVLESAGGSMTDVQGNRIRYNKTDILNPWFLACGDPDVDWRRFADDVR